jgi:AI-2 transport protein TqsA
LWGVISFITNYIPNIGFVLGVIPPALIGLLQGGWSLMFLVIALYSVINFVIQTLIQPKFVGDSVNLATTVTFLSMTIWTWIIGPLGAFLAIPLTLLTKALLVDIDPSTRWIGLLLQSGKARPADLALLQESGEPVAT